MTSVGAVREPPVPPPAGTPPHPTSLPFLPTPIVIPAKAGIQRGRGRPFALREIEACPEALEGGERTPGGASPPPTNHDSPTPFAPPVGAIRESPLPVPPPHDPATAPFPPRPAPRYPPPMAHARNLLEQPLAPTVRIEERVRYGSPTAGICFNTAERSWIGFVAAMRHRQYKAIARTRFPQLRRARTTRVSPATTPRENNRPKRRPAPTTASLRQCLHGTPTAGICFSRHSDLGFGCIAAMRHDSYTYDCRSKVPPATKGLPKQSSPNYDGP